MAKAKKAVSKAAVKKAAAKSTPFKRAPARKAPVNKTAASKAAPQAAQLSRQERKKLLTRENLLIAAQELMLERSLEDISVNDITERADVGLGTFYNYFKTKKDVLDDLFELALNFYHKELDQITENLQDPAEILAASIIYTTQKASDTSQFGWFIFDIGFPRDVFRQNIYQRAFVDFERAINQQRFSTQDVPLALIMLEGSVMSVAESIYRGVLPKKAVFQLAEMCLRQLGLDPKDAKAVANKKYPKVKMASFPLRLTEL